MNNFEFKKNDEHGVSPLVVLYFIREKFKILFGFSLLGLTIAITYLFIAPNMYEATAQIVMAQIPSASGNNFSPGGMNLEDPGPLALRLSMPSSLSKQNTIACGINESEGAETILAKRVKSAPSKISSNILEMRIYAESPEIAQVCAEEIFNKIKVSQEELLVPYVAMAQTKIAEDKESLYKLRELIESNKSLTNGGVLYFSLRDEMRYLMDDITQLKNLIASGEIRGTRLLAPIYVNPTPVLPKKSVILMAGLFAGLFFGLLAAIISRSIFRHKD